MSKRKKKKSILNSTFYRVYFAVVALGIVAIVVGCVMLNGTLQDYESAQPVYVAENVAALFENGRYDSIFAKDTSMADVDESDRDFYIQKLSEYAEGKTVTWTEVHSSDPDRKVYRVSLDGDRFAEFSLMPSGILTAHKNKVWTLDSITTYVDLQPKEEVPVETPAPEPTATPIPRTVCHVIAPSDFTVTADGKQLSASDVAGSVGTIVPNGFLPEDIQAPTLIEYAFYAESDAPVIQAKDRTGTDQPVTQTDEFSWSCAYPEDNTLKAQVEENVIKVAEKIAAFFSKDADKGAATQYCHGQSPAREILDSYDPKWGTSHKSHSYENIVTSQYYVYSDDCFSCHVTFDYIAVFKNGSTTTYPTAYTLCFYRKNGKMKLYNFTLS